LLALPQAAQARIASAIDALAGDPRPSGVTKLRGPEGFYRIRVGDYRVVYAIEDDVLLVLVVRVGHRREVYR
jgi:mRNA interferase RelE/StbE